MIRLLCMLLLTSASCTRVNAEYCAADGDCGTGRRCDPEAHRCVAGVPLDGGADGAARDAADDRRDGPGDLADAADASPPDGADSDAPSCDVGFGGGCPEVLVDDDGADCAEAGYAVLQLAIDENPSAVIGVCAGTYGAIAVAGGDITLIGSDAGEARIAPLAGRAVDATGGALTIDGMTVEGAVDMMGHGVVCVEAEVALRQVRVVSSGARGVWAGDGCHLTIDRSFVEGNGDEGLKTTNVDELHVTNSFFVENGDDGVDLDVDLGAPFTFAHNTLVANGGDGATCATALVLQNTLSSGNGDDIAGACAPLGECAGPSFDDAYHLAAGSPCIDEGVPSAVDVDYDGDARPLDGDGDGTPAHDVGADEYAPK
ncbi:MAG: right-handed parallel beta-helix repeat-containing protein [Myxococcota bacterium]